MKSRIPRIIHDIQTDHRLVQDHLDALQVVSLARKMERSLGMNVECIRITAVLQKDTDDLNVEHMDYWDTGRRRSFRNCFVEGIPKFTYFTAPLKN